MTLILQPLQRGFTLLEGLLGLSVLMGLLVLGAHHTQGRLEDQFCQNAAAHLRVVADAAERYVLDDYGQRGVEAEQQQWQREQQQAAEADRQSLETWRYQQLIDKQYLPQYFNKKNFYGQRYSLTVKREVAPQTHLQLLVLTTGRAIQERALRQIARQLGRRGGYISSIDKDPNDNFYITGNQKGWTLPLTPETLYQSPDSPEEAQPPPIYPDPGHLASLSLLYDDEVLRGTTMLHRTAMPGKPQLNQMETDLVMQQHQIVLEDGSHSGRLDAHKLELTKESGQEVKLTMNPEKITFTGERIPERWRQQVKSYSASELHRYWNKVPYYELHRGISNPETEQFADALCAEEMGNHWAKHSNTGRLFMLGFDQHPESRLYLCGHAPSTGFRLAGPKAQLLHSINYSPKQKLKDFGKASNKKLDDLKDRVRTSFGISLNDQQVEEISKILQW